MAQSTQLRRLVWVSPLLMAIAVAVAVLVVILGEIHSAQAIRFEVAANAQECFSQHLPADIDIVFLWHVVRGGDLDIRVRMSDPSGKVIFEELHSDEEDSGEHEFTPDEVGDYEICFDNRMSTWTPKVIAFSLLTELDNEEEVPVHKAIPAGLADIYPTETSLNTLDTRMKDLHNHFRHLKTLEAQSRKTIENTNSRVMWISIGESLVLLGMSIGQIFYLRRFFETRRPV